MITALLSRLVILAFGTLYPAYASYKAVRTKDVKEYVKWMMYWIVFALFTCVETFTDVLFSFWFPFYYELKVAIVLWLLSPATKGSSFLYRNFVHPAFQKRESEIDEYLSSAKEKGYTTVMSIGSKGVSYATNMIVQTAIKGGGGFFEQIRKSYSLSDLAPKVPEGRSMKQVQSQQLDTDATDLTTDPRPNPRGRRGLSSNPGVDLYFSEVDVNLRQYHGNEHLGEIRSTEDISSGYSSTDQLFTSEGVLMRTSSVTSGRGRGRGGRVTQPRRPPLAEDKETWATEERISDQSFPTTRDLTPPSSPRKSDFQSIRKKFEEQPLSQIGKEDGFQSFESLHETLREVQEGKWVPSNQTEFSDCFEENVETVPTAEYGNDTTVRDVGYTTRDKDTIVIDGKGTVVKDNEDSVVKHREHTVAKIREDSEVKDREDSMLKDREDSEVKYREDSMLKDREESEVKYREDSMLKIREETVIKDKEDDIIRKVEEETVSKDVESNETQGEKRSNIFDMLDEIVSVENNVLNPTTLQVTEGPDALLEEDKPISERDAISEQFFTPCLEIPIIKNEEKFEILELSEPMFVRRPGSRSSDQFYDSEDGPDHDESDSMVSCSSDSTTDLERRGRYNKYPAPAPPCFKSDIVVSGAPAERDPHNILGVKGTVSEGTLNNFALRVEGFAEQSKHGDGNDIKKEEYAKNKNTEAKSDESSLNSSKSESSSSSNPFSKFVLKNTRNSLLGSLMFGRDEKS